MKPAKPRNAIFPALLLALATGLLGCSDPESFQSQMDTPSPDGSRVATVRNKNLEDTTGTVPQLLLRRAADRKAKPTLVLQGAMNSFFQVSWTSTNQILAEYTTGEGDAHLPATTNFDNITITFKPSPQAVPGPPQ